MSFPTEGIHHQYMKMPPEVLIVKIQATWEDGSARIKAVVNSNYNGDVFFDETADLLDGDSIYAQEDGLVVLRDGASTDNVELWDDRHILIGLVNQDALILFPTVAP